MTREVRFGLVTLGLSIGLVLVGLVPTRQLSGPGATASLVAGVAVSLAASWAGAIPLTLLRNHSAGSQSTGALMAAMAIRFLVVLALALLVAISGKVNQPVFLIWVGLSYMMLLVVDTRYALGSASTLRKEQS